MSLDVCNMVVGENSQVVPTEGICVADENKILCIIRDLVSTTNPGCKHTLNLPASTRLSQVFREMAKTCGYVEDSISIHYEHCKETKLLDVELNKMEDRPLSDLVAEGVKRHNFTIQEKDGRSPQKVESDESTTSGYESRASSSTSHTSTTAGETFSYTSSDYTGLIKSDTGYVGLVNQAMTCYLNSLIQTLFMTPEFRNAIYRYDFTGTQEEMKKSIPCQLQKLFLQLQTSKKKAAETTDLTKSFGWDSSEVWQQHDVQELFRVMFDALETKWKKTDQENLISQLYQGKMNDYVKCLECGYESARTDSYLDIPLVIRPFGSTDCYGSVEEAMKAFVQHEILDGSNQYYCERCQKKCNAHKGLKFLTFPYLLTLQMKRFDFDFTSMHRIKLNDKMTFPDILHLNQFIDPEDGICSVSGENLETDVSSFIVEEKTSTSSIPIDSDEGIDEGIEVENGLSAASSSSEGSNFSSEAATNDKNARECTSQGPYVYELFSIMIHAGSAAGGHYYAYIKSFKDGKWYSFNDQQVTRITDDDIRKTYGGSSVSRGFYSSAYASSTNAYMLMYRQIDKEKNADFMQPEQFPKPLKDYLQQQQAKEEAERKQREIEKSTCKIKLYCIHPTYQRKLDYRFEIHKDKNLKEATEMAYTALELDSVLPLDCCRLVKYDDYSDTLERSFEGEMNVTMGELLGGVKTSYNFDLLFETKSPDQVFQEYKPGGITVKVFVVDIYKEIIEPPFNVRACHAQTVQELKNMICQVKEIPDMSKMRCVLERCHSDFRSLVPNKTLKSEGFFKSNKVYIEYSGDEEDNRVQFVQSKFYKLIDQHQNTIRINVFLPALDEVEEYKRTLQQNSLRRQQLCLNSEPTCDNLNRDTHDLDSVDIKLRTTAIQDGHTGHSVSEGSHDLSDVSPPESDARSASPLVPSSSSQDTSTSAEFSLTTNYNSNNEAQSLSPDDVHILGDRGPAEHVECSSDQASPVMGPVNKGDSSFPTEENWDLEIGASADNMCASSTKDVVSDDFQPEPTYRYFHTSICEVNQLGQRSLTVFVDKRITLGAFKKNMELVVGIPSEHFKVYRVYANNQEFESIRLSDTLQFMEDGKLNIKLGRALRPGEHRVKVFQLLVNESDSCKYLIETVVAKGMTVLESKKLIIPEVKEQCDIDIPLDRCRLRKKTWKNPGQIYTDSQSFDDEIAIYPNGEVFLEVLSGPEQMHINSQLALYVRRWRPSLYVIEPFQEVVLDHQTVDCLKENISKISGIPVENIDFAKGKGTFPCEVSVLDIHNDLEWNPQVSTLNVWPLYISDDGNVIYYRDKTEELIELSDDRKKEIQQKENLSNRVSYSPRKERALKIYTDDPPPSSSSKSSPDLD